MEASFSPLLSHISNQMRKNLSNLHLAAQQAIPPESRESDPALDEKAALLDQSYYQLLRMINCLSLLEQLEGDRPPALRDEDVVALIAEHCEKVADFAEQKGLAFQFTCAMERRLCAIAAPAVEHLFYHLISNAFRFTAPGGTVSVSLLKSGAFLELSVKDTGCGMSEELLRTWTSDAEAASQQSMGRLLCRRIVQMHGGTLAVRSVPGQGSCFTVSFPDRQLGNKMSDILFQYTDGFNKTLVGLADALPYTAFLLRNEL